MDALEKLAEKNRAHKKHLNDDRSSLAIIAIGLLPFYVDLAYSLFTTDFVFPQTFFNAVLSCIGSLCFSYPILTMVDVSFLSKKIKAIVLVVTQTWFVYFWVFNGSGWVAFMPLIPVYLVVRRQLTQIKVNADNDANHF